MVHGHGNITHAEKTQDDLISMLIFPSPWPGGVVPTRVSFFLPFFLAARLYEDRRLPASTGRTTPNDATREGCKLAVYTRIKIGIGVPWRATGMVEIGDNYREQVANDETLSRWRDRVPAYYLARHSVSPRSLVARMIMRSPIMADEFAP